LKWIERAVVKLWKIEITIPGNSPGIWFILSKLAISAPTVIKRIAGKLYFSWDFEFEKNIYVAKTNIINVLFIITKIGIGIKERA
jgi:hypothetical protein